MNDQQHAQLDENFKRLNKDNRVCDHQIYESWFEVDGKQFYGEYCITCQSCWPINNE